MASGAKSEYQTSVNFICVCFNISRNSYYYQPKLSNENEIIADWLLRLTTEHRRWGFKLRFLYLRNIKSFKWNHKRVYRICRELDLNHRIKPRRRIKRDKPEALSVPMAINQTWSMGFMSDTLTDGRSIRTFHVVDDYNREGLNIDLSMLAQRVIQ